LYGDQQVAIKVLSTQNVEQELVEFQKEFEILRNLNSEYMIKFYGAVVEKYLMMVMELCEKGSLYDVLQKVCPFAL
jgi:serine/threonine protein kinase